MWCNYLFKVKNIYIAFHVYQKNKRFIWLVDGMKWSHIDDQKKKKRRLTFQTTRFSSTTRLTSLFSFSSYFVTLPNTCIVALLHNYLNSSGSVCVRWSMCICVHVYWPTPSKYIYTSSCFLWNIIRLTFFLKMP